MAAALKIVGYSVVTQADVAEFSNIARVLDDEHIIPWLAERNGVWVHKDNDSRTRHAKLIVLSSVRTIWLAEPQGSDFSSRGQLRLVSFALPQILREWANDQPEWRHYEVRPRGQDRIRVAGFAL